MATKLDEGQEIVLLKNGKPVKAIVIKDDGKVLVVRYE